MNAALLVDLVLTATLSAALVAGGGVTLWLLPWSDADRDGTVRALANTVRRVAEVTRPRGPFRAIPVAR